MQIEQAIERCEFLQRSADNNGKRNTAISGFHKESAEALKMLIDLVKSNELALHYCKNCGAPILGTKSKSYCNNKCRQATFRNKNK